MRPNSATCVLRRGAPLPKATTQLLFLYAITVTVCNSITVTSGGTKYGAIAYMRNVGRTAMGKLQRLSFLIQY